MPNLPRTTAAGLDYLALFAAHTMHVYRTPGRPGNGFHRAALDRLLRDGLVRLGDYRALHGKPVLVTDLGRAVLAARAAADAPHPN